MSTFRSTGIPEIEGLKEYIDSIAGKFCPFIRPSTRAQSMRTSVYELSGVGDRVELSMFYLGLLHTEILRRTRFQAPPRRAVLACENLIFRFDGEDQVDGESLFAWPHWLLKTRYTNVGVMFGKFWLGEEADSRLGQPIPAPPYHILSIRSAVIKRDPQFFHKAPGLLGDLLTSDDDGRDIMGLNELPVALPESEWTATMVQEASQSLLTSGFYETMKEQAAKELKPAHD